MIRTKTCADFVRAQLPDRNSWEVEQITKEMENYKSEFFSKRGNDGVDFQTKAKEYLKELKTELREIAQKRKKDALKRADFITFASQYKDPNEALLAYTGGQSMNSIKGSRRSSKHLRDELQRRWTALLETGMEEIPERQRIMDGFDDRELAIALHEVRTGAKPADVPTYIWEAAKVIDNVNRVIVDRLKREGSLIKEIDNYVMKQSHDRAKIRTVGEDVWKKYIYDRLNKEQTFGNIPIERHGEFLSKIYKQINLRTFGGVDDVTRGLKDPKSVFGTTGDVAARVARHRTLIFQDGKSFYEYNEMFGEGKIFEGTSNSIQRQARNASLMHFFGSDPVANFDMAIKEWQTKLIEDGDKSTEDELNKVASFARALIGKETGASSTNSRVDKVVRGVSAFESFTHLGNAMLRSWVDLPMTIATIQQFNPDATYFGTLNGLVRDYVGAFKSKDQAIKAAREASVSLNDYKGGYLEEFSSEVMEFTHKINGMTAHNRGSRVSIAKALDRSFTSQLDKSWDQLDQGTRDTFGTYDIDQADWAIIQQSIDENGFSIQAMEELPFHLINKGHRDRLVDNLGIMKNDFADIGSSTPGLRQQFVFGLEMNAFMKLVFQFTGSARANMRNAGRLAKNAPMSVTAQYVLGAAAISYVTDELIDFATKGELPTKVHPQKITKALVSSGIGGLYADYIFRVSDSREPIMSVLGPAARDASELAKGVFQTVYDPNKNEFQFEPKKLKALIPKFTPNLIYTKLILDSAIMNGIRQSVDPRWEVKNRRESIKQGKLHVKDIMDTI